VSGDFAGGCLCGAVRYRATQMLRAGLCHCRMCQKASGAPVVAWLMVPVNAFSFTEGQALAYRSSPRALRHFCGICGSQLTARLAEDPSEIDINLATLDHPEAVAPQYHIYTASQLPWLDIHDGLPRHEGDREQ
jgi:hypothetical protein